ncbi:hypothetical protein PIB30_080098 [Stylosanthes scabra]|uniref:Uncharacterized protein n=1 Tax=Stylosanthes scabra TaxID=79078 RepID=A0ABU6RRM3_9FABA|nr:hypothetical protein [Stylosanthes scabra]
MNVPRPLSRPVQNSLILKTGYRCRGIQTRCEIDDGVKLGFKEARPWLGNLKFQFWPSFNVLQQRKVAYATLFQKARRRLQGRKLHAQLRKLRTQLGLDRIKIALCSSIACVTSLATSLATCKIQNPPFLLLFMNPLLPMPSLAFPCIFQSLKP